MRALPALGLTAALAAPLAAIRLGAGTSAETGCWLAAFALAALALFGAAGWVRLGGWGVAICAFPLIQLLPWGAQMVDRPGLGEALAAVGIEAPRGVAVSAAGAVAAAAHLAGACATYWLARAAARRSTDAAWWAAAGVAAFCCLEAAGGAGQYLRGALGGAPVPASGSFVNRGQFAALLVLGFGFGCGLAASAWTGLDRRRLDERAFAGGALGLATAAVSLAGVGLSLSRAGIAVATLAAGAAAMWMLRRRAWWAAPVALAGVLAAAGAPGAVDRAAARFEQLADERGEAGRRAVWADTLRLVEERPWTGVGAGGFDGAFRRTSFYLPRKSIGHAHSAYLERLAEWGLPGFLLLAVVVLSAPVAAARALRRTGDARRARLGAGCLLGASTVLLQAAVDLPLEAPVLAALVGASIGLAAGLGDERSEGSPGLPSRAAMAAGAALFAVLAVARAQGWPAESAAVYAWAAEAFGAGRAEEAAVLYRQAVQANPLAAAPWLRLAEIERGRGDDARALAFARAARAVEPFALRTEWPLAELELASGAGPAGLERLAGVTEALPEMLPAALAAVWRAGAAPEAIERAMPLSEPRAIGDYLVFLARTGDTQALEATYERLGRPAIPGEHAAWLERQSGLGGLVRSADRRSAVDGSSP